ncbi:hypothetical protein [Pontibacter pamirensis]|uniref:hypothetical protein n=1 Tax=Pontibacter pamirensis TaxID=2562824 RepID=UPI00138A3F77|nr:hypothetical protein [Pontibacter pamirensis]
MRTGSSSIPTKRPGCACRGSCQYTFSLAHPGQPEKEAGDSQGLRDDEKRQPEPDPKQVIKGKCAAGEHGEDEEDEAVEPLEGQSFHGFTFYVVFP